MDKTGLDGQELRVEGGEGLVGGDRVVWCEGLATHGGLRPIGAEHLCIQRDGWCRDDVEVLPRLTKHLVGEVGGWVGKPT